ncbi:type IV pilus assembly protein PilM [Nitrosomonas cryotolerans]|uniref:Type IV pilus assembly protein PilM n=1 Tax=Nitrosomonas cryotolerans ATCC 49181 TaxID=1131553 RepID=A0A1N6HLC5_9PROT|nr:pilus assembly protein PilM [Nitrosomonas cryotolerans]SFP64419.1 type IV pilus assembly protein PilM [Nitrosomonas cryotolerans]SIO20571.1 type IV pilus assembly protein PilM [Nitrosomonas cryotolerans ATCC 49181]
MFQENFNINIDFLKMKSPLLIGVDISSSSVKMVELSLVDKEKGIYRIERYAIEPLPEGTMQDGGIVNLEAVSESMRQGWKRMNAKLKNIALALPSADVITKKIIVPAGQREDDLAFQVENEAGQYIPFALEEVNLDFQITKHLVDSPDEIEVLIAASRKDKVEDRVAAALSAGLKAMIMDVEPYAAQAAFELIKNQLLDDGKDQVIALIDIGATVMSINVLHNGEFVYMRDQPFGGNQLTQEIRNQYNLSLEEAEMAKRSGNLPDNYQTDVLQPFCETLSVEVMRAIQFFFTSTQYGEINYILIAGGCAVIPGLKETIATRTQVSTLVVNPFSSMELSNHIVPKQLNLDAPSLLIACGLAMRSFDPA